MKHAPGTAPKGATRAYLGGKAYVRDRNGRTALTLLERAPANFEPWGRAGWAFDFNGCARAFDSSTTADGDDYTPVAPQYSPHFPE